MKLKIVGRKPIYWGFLEKKNLRFHCYCHQLGQGNFPITHGVTSLITVTLVSYCHLYFICLLTLPVNKSHLLEHFNGVRELLNETAAEHYPIQHTIAYDNENSLQGSKMNCISCCSSGHWLMQCASAADMFFSEESKLVIMEKSSETEILRLQLLLSKSTQRCIGTETVYSDDIRNASHECSRSSKENIQWNWWEGRKSDRRKYFYWGKARLSS